MASSAQPNFRCSLEMFSHSGSVANGTIEYRGLTEDRIEEALALQQESMRRESLALGVGMFEEEGAAEEMKKVFREVVKDGCSVVAIDVRTEEVIAVAFIKLHVQQELGAKDPLELFIENNMKHKPCLALINFIGEVESKVNLFERYNASVLMEIFYFGTDPRYQGCHVGQHVIEASLELARALRKGKLAKTPIGEELVLESAVPEVAFGVFASNFSFRVAEKLNFECLATVHYDDYLQEGVKMSERIGDLHKTAKLAALRI